MHQWGKPGRHGSAYQVSSPKLGFSKNPSYQIYMSGTMRRRAEVKKVGKAQQEQWMEKMYLYRVITRLLCRFGFHSFRIIDVTMGFGGAGGVERVECRRCCVIMTRKV